MDIASPLFDQSGRLVLNKNIQTYFDIYGFQTNPLNLDKSEISELYLTLSKRIHPDFFINASTEEIELSIFYSELVNNGYKVLKNPFKRARYFLTINDSLNETKEIPKEVIDDVFDIQELLEQDKLNESDQNQLDNYVERFTKIQLNYKNKLNQLFEESKNIPETDLFEKLNQLVSANAYVQRIFTNIEKKQEILDSE